MRKASRRRWFELSLEESQGSWDMEDSILCKCTVVMKAGEGCYLTSPEFSDNHFDNSGEDGLE